MATNDVHFVNMEDAEAHDHLICLNTGKDLDDPTTNALYTPGMVQDTGGNAGCIFRSSRGTECNTIEVAEKVEQYELDCNPVMPYFPLPEGFDNEDEYLKHITYEGAKETLP